MSDLLPRLPTLTSLIAKAKGRGGLTPTQLETQRYVPLAKEKELKERRGIQPLAMLFDLLQRGQYTSANIVDEVIESIQSGEPLGQLLKEAALAGWQGLTGKRKGEFKDVLVKRFNMSDEPIFGEKQKDKFLLGATPAGTLGFLLDIVLDPTTYMSFGASKAARATASQFAADSVQVASRNLGDLVKLKKVAKGALDDSMVGKLYAESQEKGAKYVLKHGGDDAARAMNDVYKQAYREGLRKPAAELKEQIGEGVARSQEHLYKQMYPKDMSLDAFMKASTQPSPQLDALQKIMERTYGGGGERTFRFIRGEHFKSVRPPALPIQKWESLTKKFAKTPAGSKLSDAWWAVQNKGPIAAIRNTLGIRNPYQKLQRMHELEAGNQMFQEVSGRLGNEFMQIAAKYDDDVLDEWKRVIEYAEQAFKKEPGVTVFDVLNRSDVVESLGIKNTDEVLNFAKEYAAFNRRMNQEELDWIGRGFFTDRKSKENYLATAYRENVSLKRVPQAKGTYTPSTGMTRQFTRMETMDQEIAKIKWAWGLSTDDARNLIEDHQLGGYITDVRELVMTRIVVHSKMAARVNMLEKFKQFGIPTDEFYGDLAMAVQKTGGRLEMAGLTTIDDPALQGLLFDKDVAEILTRAARDTSDKAVNSMARLWHNRTSWWKGIVTMTTGFHARNFLSNEMTGYLKNGMKWFNVKKYDMPSAVATIYALGKDNPEALIKSMGIDNAYYKRMLNTRHGNHTLRELGDYAREKGIVSEAVHGFDVSDVVKKFGGKKANLNPFSTEFVGIELSHKVGSLVESQARFKSFFIDYLDTAGKAGDDAALEYAKQQAKFWFLDYSDLTEAEKRIKAWGIPFYCVPDDAEILTKDGWRTYDKVVLGQECLTYNVEKNIQEWQPIREIAVFGFDGDLLHLKNRTVDLLCTEDHRFPIYVRKTFVKNKWYGGGRRIKRAYELNTGDCLLLSAPYEYMESILSPRDAAILGWIVTDGYHRWRGKHLEMMIYQHPKKYAKEIRELLGEYMTSESPPHPETGTICFRVGAVWTNKIKRYFESKDDMPGIVTRLSSEAVQSMWDAMFMAEGSIGKRGTKKEFLQFAQKEGPVLDAFQILCQLMNRPYYPNRDFNGTRYGYIKKVNKAGFKDVVVTKEKYSGKIWCPRTDNSTWVMRQNGKVIISGNTWIRKNISVQMHGIITHPEMYGTLPKIQEAMQSDDPSFNPDLIPAWMKGRHMFPFRKGEGGKFTMFDPNFPFQDINKIPLMFEEGKFLPRPNWKELKDDIMNMAHPALKAAVELLPEKGYNIYFKGEMQPNTKAPYVVRFLSKSPKITTFLDGVMRGAGYENGLRLEFDDQGRMKIDSKTAQVLYNFLPIMKPIENVILLGTTVFPGMEKLIEDISGAKDDYEGLEQFMQVMSRWVGVKTKEADLEAEKDRMRNSIYYEAERLRKERRRISPQAQLRSTRAKETLEETKKKVVGF